jgi:polysaccharide biosynthesis/export protein
MPRIVSIVVLLLFVAACSGPVVKNGTPVNALQSGQGQTVRTEAGEYHIQPGDSLDIKFFYNPNLNESVLVLPDGRISLQLARNILAAGRTTEELVGELTQRYEPHLARTEITVLVRQLNSQKVYVDGEVARPGIVPLVGTMTVLQSIAAAGGLKDSARTNELIIIRKGLDNRPVALTLDAGKIIDGTDTGQDIALMAADIVFVPKSPVGNVNKWVDLYIRRNIPIGTGFGYSISNYQ